MVLPQDFADKMRDMLGDEYAEFCKAFCAEENFCGIRINTLKKGARVAVSKVLGGFDTVPWCENGCYGTKELLSGKHPYHAAGLFYFQEPSAMAAVPVLGIKHGDRVLDLCAAPGGKATQAAAELAGTGLLVANEIIPQRAKIVSENIERMGVKNAVVTNETPERLAEKFPEEFDSIILDAPCSGEGMFRKEPQAISEWSLAHSETCAVRQKKIADCAVKMLAAGGRLVYSTCTFAHCENEGVAEYITKTYPEMKLIKISENSLLDGYDAEGKTKRIFPHKMRGEGHFIALFQKDGERPPRNVQKKAKKIPPEAEAFIRENLNCELSGEPVLFGDRLYLLPEPLDLDKIKVLRAGLELGEVRKGRFIPSHALALALEGKDFKNTVNPSAEDIARFMHGETLSAESGGWCGVLADGYPLGWGKCSGGILKNHYPKHLRI
ncbi:MAG: RsmB/NOP family class I SAM-dependent RNA methyltransferase [Clostridia bacterium]|nr:RsmB/NOP family class I SAM-dependent RNA methyltransferase [Clostridia bacterium]